MMGDTSWFVSAGASGMMSRQRALLPLPTLPQAQPAAIDPLAKEPVEKEIKVTTTPPAILLPLPRDVEAVKGRMEPVLPVLHKALDQTRVVRQEARTIEVQSTPLPPRGPQENEMPIPTRLVLERVPLPQAPPSPKSTERDTRTFLDLPGAAVLKVPETRETAVPPPALTRNVEVPSSNLRNADVRIPSPVSSSSEREESFTVGSAPSDRIVKPNASEMESMNWTVRREDGPSVVADPKVLRSEIPVRVMPEVTAEPLPPHGEVASSERVPIPVASRPVEQTSLRKEQVPPDILAGRERVDKSPVAVPASVSAPSTSSQTTPIEPVQARSAERVIAPEMAEKPRTSDQRDVPFVPLPNLAAPAERTIARPTVEPPTRDVRNTDEVIRDVDVKVELSATPLREVPQTLDDPRSHVTPASVRERLSELFAPLPPPAVNAPVVEDRPRQEMPRVQDAIRQVPKDLLFDAPPMPKSSTVPPSQQISLPPSMGPEPIRDATPARQEIPRDFTAPILVSAPISSRTESPRGEFIPALPAPPMKPALETQAVMTSEVRPDRESQAPRGDVSTGLVKSPPALVIERVEPLRVGSVESKSPPVAVPIALAVEPERALQASASAGDVAVIPKNSVDPLPPSPAIPLPVHTEKDRQEEQVREMRREVVREAQRREVLEELRGMTTLWAPQERPSRPEGPISGSRESVIPANTTEREPADKRNPAPRALLLAPARAEATQPPATYLRAERLENIGETGPETVARAGSIGDNNEVKSMTAPEPGLLAVPRAQGNEEVVPVVYAPDPTPPPRREVPVLSTEMRSRYVRVPVVNVLDLVL